MTTSTKKLILKIAFVSIRIHTKAAPIKNKHFSKHTQNKKTYDKGYRKSKKNYSPNDFIPFIFCSNCLIIHIKNSQKTRLYLFYFSTDGCFWKVLVFNYCKSKITFYSQLIEQQSTAQLSQSLQGTIPGLQVTRSSSMPGASASLQIRGVTSINGSSPLILVDGMAVSSIDNVASDDVEQITVLKDAASASIYGARAAAGVILITTKSAKEGQLSIDYKGEYSMVTATEWADYLNDPYNYMTMFNEYKWNDAGCPGEIH